MKHLLGIVLLLGSISWVFALSSIPMDGNKEVQANFLGSAQSEKMLLFFGPVYCGSQCPVTMRFLSGLYEENKGELQKKGWSFAFVNLEEGSDPVASEIFAQGFHEDFLGFGLAGEQFAQAKREFNITFQKQSEQDFSHSRTIYLLERVEGKWRIRYLQENLDGAALMKRALAL